MTTYQVVSGGRVGTRGPVSRRSWYDPRMLLLLILALLAAPEDDWPSRGDTLHISAELTMVTGWYNDESPIPPCVPFMMKSTGAKKWKVRPPNATWAQNLTLKGPWEPRMHRDEAACLAYFEEHGQPRTGFLMALQMPMTNQQRVRYMPTGVALGSNRAQ